MNMKRIYVNSRFLTHATTGVQRYAQELIKSLDRLIGLRDIAVKDFTYILLAPTGEIIDLGLSHMETRQVGKLSGHLWEQLELPFYTRDGFLLNLCNTAPLFKRKQSVTIHDAAVYAVPQTYSFAFRTWYKILFAVVGMTSQRILTCSLFSKNQLQHYCNIRESKLQMIYHGKEHILDNVLDLGFIVKHKLDKPFVLAVSSMSPNKNFRSIVQAIELIGSTDYDIVIAGGTNPKLFKTEDKQLSSSVKYLGYVSDQELRTLYNRAACFIFPSFYEGFGLPPLEAMACGCPVIASQAASLPEVCGDAVLYCDPHSPPDIASKIEQVMQDAELRDELRLKGLAQANKFTWERCARETMSAIRENVNESAVVEVLS